MRAVTRKAPLECSGHLRGGDDLFLGMDIDRPSIDIFGLARSFEVPGQTAVASRKSVEGDDPFV